MVAAEPYQEIPPEEAQPPPSKWRRAGIVASMLAVTGVFSVGVVSRTNALRGPVKVASPTQPTNPPAVVLDEYNDPTCLRNSGGTCAVWGCNADRGPTDCVYWSPGLTHLGEHGHYCMCQPGFCAALDGKCYQNNNNVLVGSRVAIRNAQWMDHHVYIRGWDVYVDNDVPSDRGLWNVYAMPDFTGQPASNFLIMNVDYPDFALTVQRSCSTDSDTQITTCSHTPKISWMYKMDAEWITTMHTAPWMTQAYTMANMGFSNRMFTLRQFSWDVDVTHYYEAPGPAAYWVFDPPLTGPAPLPGGFR